MEQVKHTPGPWEYGEERGLCREIHADNGPELFAIAQTRHGDPEICEANARLIAAAPELLEALIAFRDGGPQGGQNFAEWHESYRPAIDKARAAIAKATGG